MKPLYLLPIILIVLMSGCAQYTSKTTVTSTEETEQTETTQQTQPKEVAPTTEQPTPSVKEFRIMITHSGGYSPSVFTVSKGDIVRFLATSDPVSHNHGIAIDAYNVNVAVTKSPSESPQVIEFTADKAGTFEIYCKSCLDGWGPHPWMKGILKVE